MRTPICDQLGTEFPILAFSHCRDVVAAVSKAGGFGVLGATTHTPDQLEVELRWIDEAVEGKPYGVDVLVPQKLSGMTAGGSLAGALADLIPEEHRTFVDRLLVEHGIEPSESTGDEPVWDVAVGLSTGGALRLIEVALAHPVRLVANALGPPPPELIDMAHDRDVLVAALSRAATAGSPGAQRLINYFVGQVVGSLNTVKPARQVVYEMVEEYVDTVTRLSGGLEG